MMKNSICTTALSIVLLASTVAAQTATSQNLKPIQTRDCYKSSGTLKKVEEYDFMSDGYCQGKCGNQLNSSVMAITGGSICYCGDVIPALDQIVPKSFCNSPCAGYNLTTCGGFGYFQVYLTGLTMDVKIAPNGTSTGSSTTPTVNKAAETVVVTNPASSEMSSSNKVGIAVGVVVGLGALTGIAGGLFFFLNQRKKRAIEEEHRRMEAQVAALAAEKASDASNSRTDQRLDSSNIFSHRRESVGSIADEMDFSRRILQVRNPDRFSAASPTV